MGEKNKVKSYPWYAPRTWHGMTLGVWWRLLRSYNFSLSPSRIPLATGVTLVSLVHSALKPLNDLVYRRKVAAVQIEEHPIFVLGHWRTGTTLLHELLALDARYSVPTTYRCMEPQHFLLTERFLKPIVRWVMPTRRPMDDMLVHLELPQEDEFALANLGVPSPYTEWAFPDLPCKEDKFLELTDLSRDELRKWKRAFRWFLRCLTLQDPRRLVLKSPPHTARVKVLLDMFPNAKFVHIARDPLKVIPSTTHTWQRLYRALGLNARYPEGEQFEDYILDKFVRMHEAYESQKSLIPAGNLYEMQFSDLVGDTAGAMRQAYEKLSLGDFAEVQPAIENYMASRKSHRKNTLEVSDSLKAKIASRCRGYSEVHGYELNDAPADQVDKATPRV